MSVEQKPRQAATVILLRAAMPKGFEVFLTRRPESMAFLGGLYCFPGGAVHKKDCSAGTLGRCRGVTAEEARKSLGAHLTPAEALGTWVAAIRELFEEAGVLLATAANGETFSAERYGKAKLRERHAALLDKTLTFQALLESDDLFCAADKLAYFSHWQTPAQFATRFDTRLFLAALPPDQSPLPSSPEVAHSLWLTPDRALELFSKDELPMIFPTFASLRTLADFETLESVLREYGKGAYHREAAP